MDSEWLAKLIEDAGYEPVINVGAIVAQGDVHTALAELIEGCESVEEAALLVKQFRTNNMGSRVFIYWPAARIAAEAA